MQGQTKIIKVDGTEEIRPTVIPWNELEDILGAEAFDVVNLRDGHVMVVDDTGALTGKPVNQKATELYRGVCRPGTEWEIRGDVAIMWDEDFE